MNFGTRRTDFGSCGRLAYACIDEKYASVRSRSFREAKEQLEKKAPGESNKDYRQRILRTTAFVATKMVNAIGKLFEDKGFEAQKGP